MERVLSRSLNYIAQAGEMATLYMDVQSPTTLSPGYIADLEEYSLLHSSFDTH